MDVKWIKINTSIFDDEKIKLVDAMPERDGIFVIWIKLLTLAGRINSDGVVHLNEDVPYNEEMLATVFNRPVGVVRLAMKVFSEFRMIEINNSVIEIINWEKHQNIDGLERIRENTRRRVFNHRERKRLEQCNVTVTQSNGAEKSRVEKNKDILSCNHDVEAILTHLNTKTGKKFRAETKAFRTLVSARLKEGYKLEDFKKVIDIKYSQWHNDPKMAKYLQPSTLFNGLKFSQYLNEEAEDPYKGRVWR